MSVAAIKKKSVAHPHNNKPQAAKWDLKTLGVQPTWLTSRHGVLRPAKRAPVRGLRPSWINSLDPYRMYRPDPSLSNKAILQNAAFYRSFPVEYLTATSNSPNTLLRAMPPRPPRFHAKEDATTTLGKSIVSGISLIPSMIRVWMAENIRTVNHEHFPPIRSTALRMHPKEIIRSREKRTKLARPKPMDPADAIMDKTIVQTMKHRSSEERRKVRLQEQAAKLAPVPGNDDFGESSPGSPLSFSASPSSAPKPGYGREQLSSTGDLSAVHFKERGGSNKPKRVLVPERSKIYEDKDSTIASDRKREILKVIKKVIEKVDTLNAAHESETSNSCHSKSREDDHEMHGAQIERAPNSAAEEAQHSPVRKHRKHKHKHYDSRGHRQHDDEDDDEDAVDDHHRHKRHHHGRHHRRHSSRHHTETDPEAEKSPARRRHRHHHSHHESKPRHLDKYNTDVAFEHSDKNKRQSYHDESDIEHEDYESYEDMFPQRRHQNRVHFIGGGAENQETIPLPDPADNGLLQTVDNNIQDPATKPNPDQPPIAPGKDENPAGFTTTNPEEKARKRRHRSVRHKHHRASSRYRYKNTIRVPSKRSKAFAVSSASVDSGASNDSTTTTTTTGRSGSNESRVQDPGFPPPDPDFNKDYRAKAKFHRRNLWKTKKSVNRQARELSYPDNRSPPLTYVVGVRGSRRQLDYDPSRAYAIIGSTASNKRRHHHHHRRSHKSSKRSNRPHQHQQQPANAKRTAKSSTEPARIVEGLPPHLTPSNEDVIRMEQQLQQQLLQMQAMQDQMGTSKAGEPDAGRESTAETVETKDTSYEESVGPQNTRK